MVIFIIIISVFIHSTEKEKLVDAAALIKCAFNKHSLPSTKHNSADREFNA